MLPHVTLGNLALQHIGEDYRISDPDEDSKPARAIKRAWEGTRLFVLSAAHWSFAVRTVALTARAADAEFPIALDRTAFPLPGDMVNLVEIVDPALDEESEDNYSVEGGPDGGMELLVEDDGPITIRYVRDTAEIAEPSRWPPAFAEAFAWRLAWQIADVMAADKGRKDRAFAQSERALRLARRSNARTKGRRAHATTPWATARVVGIGRVPNV